MQHTPDENSCAGSIAGLFRGFPWLIPGRFLIYSVFFPWLFRDFSVLIFRHAFQLIEAEEAGIVLNPASHAAV